MERRIETKGLPPHMLAAGRKVARKHAVDMEALTKGLPPYEAAAIRKKTGRERPKAEKESTTEEILLTDPSSKLQNARVRTVTKKKKPSTVNVMPEVPLFLPTVFSKFIWDEVEVQNSAAEAANS